MSPVTSKKVTFKWIVKELRIQQSKNSNGIKGNVLESLRASNHAGYLYKPLRNLKKESQNINCYFWMTYTEKNIVM